VASRRRPVIHVLAGVNGAGKSSIGGATVRAAGGDYFNPDEAARRIRAESPALASAEANSIAWEVGRALLERATLERLDFAFETTLGGATIARMLHQALAAGFQVRIWFVGLESPELHIARVRARVKAGGHDIPEAAIRARFDANRLNLIALLPVATEVRVCDNTAEADPRRGVAPQPALLLHTFRGKVRAHAPLEAVPDWAKPIIAAALRPCARPPGTVASGR
jgi:predicted ABC-type ATPase